MLAGRGDEIPVSLMPVDGTWPSGTAACEKRNIAEIVPVWDEDLCVQCGQCSFVCPHSVIQARYFDARQAGRRARRLQVGAGQRARLPGSAVHAAVLRRGLHRLLACASRPARPSPREGRKAINWRTSCRCWTEARAEPRLLRDAAGERPRAGRFRQRPRRAVPGAAVRVLRRLRRLRRDAVPEAAVAVVRRPRADRQRHRLLVDLRRQPAGHAVDEEPEGRGPAWSNSLFEDNAEFGLGFRLAADKHLELARSLLRAAGSRRSAATWSQAILNAPQIRESDIRAQRIRVATLKTRLLTLGDDAGGQGPAVGRRSSGPAQHLDRRRRRLGLRHRLWRARPRAGQRPRRQRAGAGHRGLFQHRRPGLEGDAARRGGEVRRRRQAGRRARTWRCRRSPTATSMSPRWRWAPIRSRPCRRSARPRPMPARR